MKLWTGHDFAARSCCDLDLQGSDPNVARDTSSQYGDHFCEIILKSDSKLHSYWPDMNSGRTYGRTDGRTTRRLYAPPKFFGEHNNAQCDISDL
jgi:hypothetical protein